MEQTMSNRLQLRHTILLQLIERAEEIKKKSEGGVPVQELTEVNIKLKNVIDMLEKDLQNFLECGKQLNQIQLHIYTTDQLKAEDLLMDLQVIKTLNKQEASHSKDTHTRLPKLEIPKFNGDGLKWYQFWDRFESAIDKSDLTDADKLVYLIGCMEGPAMEKLAGLTTTNSNYSVAVEILKKKYGNKNKLIDNHHRAIQKIKPASEEGNDCRRTLDEIEKHMRILQELGEDVNGNHFRVTLESKFPDSVLFQVNLQTGADDTTETLLKNLDLVVTAMERVKGTMEREREYTTAESLNVQSRIKVEKRKFKFQKKPYNETPSTSKFISKKRKAEDIAGFSSSRKKQKLQILCIFCNSPHYNDKCKAVTTMAERMKRLQGRCLNCFREGHYKRDCRIKKRCPYCKEIHNRALCPKLFKPGNYILHNTDNKKESNCLTTKTCGVYLQTATTVLENPNNKKKISCRLILDSGSQRSYITSRLANFLDLSADGEDLLLIYTFGTEKPKETCSPSVEVMLKTKRDVTKKIRVNVVPHITERVPVPIYPACETIDVFADDTNTGERIDLLIGNDYYFSFVRNEYIHKRDNLYLVNTDFGWILSGGTTTKNENILSVITYYCQCHESDCPYFTEPDLPLRSIDMKFLWSLESIGITDSPKVSQQEEAVKFFNDTVKYECGRYYVKWPWVQYPPDLPTNYGLAFGRLKSLLRRLDEETLKDYEAILKEQLNANIIEVIQPELSQSQQRNPPIHYLPHHIVKQEGKRGRIVYDASAKIKDQKSLNEGMFKGPSMLEDLTALILKFRTGKIGIVGDVEKAFLQIGLQEEDRDVTRFLWIKDINKELTHDNLVHLRFCRVPFGIISSPFLLTATIRHHISRTNETLLKKIADRCYVDNLVTNAESIEEAIQLYSETRKVFDELGMNIREWASNYKDFINEIPDQYKAKLKTEIKLLGLIWNLEEDTLKIKPNISIVNETVVTENVTKREVLKTLARLYDPCGFAAPLILPAKLLFQELCTKKVKWDSILPQELVETWDNALRNLENAKDIKIPRYVGHAEAKKEDMKYDLHCFTDASKNAYAAVIYLLAYYKNEPKTTFIMSKARITPVEDKDDLKIPRLELLGYLIGNRLLKYVKNSLELTIQSQYLWTDSLIVLNWMRSNKLLPPFVLRRINEIKQNSDVEHCYINTNHNPADLATRPELWETKKDLWFYGPEFLKESKTNWPDTMHMHTYDPQTLILAGEALGVVDGPEMTMKGYENEQEKTLDQHETELVSEEQNISVLDESVLAIKKLQQNYFREEVEGKPTNLSRNLGLFLDVDGILRCRGRITYSEVPYETKYPALIPKVSPFTEAVIKHTHESNYHVGTSHTLSIIRQKYWIPQGRATVQKIIKRCPQCVKHGGGPYKLPPTPALPSERVNYNIPFTYTGIDYFGPLYVASNNDRGKQWVCLFTCLAVRAIHLEVVKDLTAAECLLALRRFVASRGKPETITSDNSQTFKLTSEILSSTYCTQNKIKWKFIPQLAPWHGGFYERLVALVKHCLKRTLEKHLLSENQLQTIIKEVEAVVNTRPLTYVGSEPESVLRPCDFITLGKCLILETSEKDLSQGTAIKIDLINSWKKGQKIVSEFKEMFIRQYLTSLRERYQHSHKQNRVTSHRSPRLGDIVQIKDNSKNRQNWKIGKIVSLIEGTDGECRVAKVKVGEIEFSRSIGHLYPLEVDPSGECSPTRFTPLVEETDDRSENQEQNVVEVDMPPNLPTSSASPQYRESTVDLPPRIVEDTDEVANDTPISDRLSREDDTEPPSDSIDCEDNTVTDEVPDLSNKRIRREAAIRARERIAEWTQHLCILLR